MHETCQEKASADWPAAVRFFARLGWISFGGPAGQIAILREELVERRRWLTSHEFSSGLNFCLLLPGPEAHQLVIYSGWKLHGLRGALAAGVLFVLPAILLLWAAAALYAVYGQLAWAQTLFGTVRPAVLAIIIAALVRMARHHLHGTRAWLLAVAAFAAMFFYQIPFPWIVVAALGLGAVKQQSQIEIAPSQVVVGIHLKVEVAGNPGPHVVEGDAEMDIAQGFIMDAHVRNGQMALDIRVVHAPLGGDAKTKAALPGEEFIQP
jgi:chromate transporter